MSLVKNISLAVLLSASFNSLADIAIIVNPANANALTDKEISRAFLGKLKTYADGQSIEPINTKAGNAARAEFEQKVLKKSSSQVKAYWSKLVFTGKGKPPQELSSDSEVLSKVASSANAIGYVDAAAVNDSVKVIKTL